MKTGLNWGFWIVVSFMIFAAGTFTMVYISMSSHEDLVTDDYYEKELKYQQHIDLVKNTNALDQKVEMDFIASSLVIKFPRSESNDRYAGTIYFFRPSDKRGDFTRNIDLDSNRTQKFPLSIFSKGLWRVKISWNAGNEQYYSEFPLIIQ